MNVLIKVFLVLLIVHLKSISNTSPIEASSSKSVSSNSSQTRIYGGKRCSKAQLSLIVSLRNRTNFICAATMLNSLWGLTAAHCEDNNVAVVVGERKSSYVYYKVKKIYVHPEYHTTRHYNDIALIILKSPMKIKRIKFVKLPEPGKQICSVVMVKGWGLTEKQDFSRDLLCVDLPVINSTECQKIYGSTFIQDPEKVICTHSTEHKDACEGDSGGPVTCGTIQVGIVSWGVNCADAYFPGVHTKVEAYLDFISEIMKTKTGKAIYIKHNTFFVALSILMSCVQYQFL